jgi:hypothetical protein
LRSTENRRTVIVSESAPERLLEKRLARRTRHEGRVAWPENQKAPE